MDFTLRMAWAFSYSANLMVSLPGVIWMSSMPLAMGLSVRSPPMASTRFLPLRSPSQAFGDGDAPDGEVVEDRRWAGRR